jgi:hypothetical protein
MKYHLTLTTSSGTTAECVKLQLSAPANAASKNFLVTDFSFSDDCWATTGIRILELDSIGDTPVTKASKMIMYPNSFIFVAIL